MRRKGGPVTPLRQRYIDDLRLKNFSPGTIKVYVHAVAQFARHFGQSPDTLSGEDVRAYFVQLLDRGLARSSCVVVRSALRHLYADTLGRPDCLASVPRPKRERRLPVVLSREEVRRLFANVTNLKQTALFMVAYDAGLRLSELLNLRIDDIDSQRMVLRIRQGQGKKDRYARLTPGLLKLLRSIIYRWPIVHLQPWRSILRKQCPGLPHQILRRSKSRNRFQP